MQQLIEKIENVEIVSFDVFDTLIKRCVNTPEDVFDVVGKQFGLINFRESRCKNQMMASQRVEREQNVPHADMNQIYEYIREHDERDIKWDNVMQMELQIEEDCLYRNDEMYDIFMYALELGKKVIITSDMYLFDYQVEKILDKCGYRGYDKLYVSANVHTTKYGGTIFKYVMTDLGVDGKQILHIGDNKVSDYENAQKAGWNAFHYQPVRLDVSRKGRNISAVNWAVNEELLSKNKEFWYGIGSLVGGDLYLGLKQWVKARIKEIGYKKVYFLARDGYNLYQIFKDDKDIDCEYLYMSRRALVLAGITKLDAETLENLPPYTLNQTVKEVLEYLGVEDVCNQHLKEAGFNGLDDVIKTFEDIKKVKQLFVLNEKAFLEKCAEERAYAQKYFEQMGFYNQDNIVFDCGWNGSSQYFLERFMEVSGYEYEDYFLYVGIMETDKSRRQLKGRSYDTYLFNHGEALELQKQIKDAIVLFELFFGAPEQSVYNYNENGVVFEQLSIDETFKVELCQGIKDYINMAEPFVEKYGIHISTENALSGLVRLVNEPTMEEAKRIGDLKNVDGFVAQQGVEKYVAKLDYKTYMSNPNIEIYWLQGLLKRDDIEQKLKDKILTDRGLTISQTEKKQKTSLLTIDKRNFWIKLLEDKYRIPENDLYQTWIEENEIDVKRIEQLEYNPLFSVVVPVYNVVDEQLIECIESVVNQTYKNWELILVDDASTWESVRDILRKYEKHERINVHYRTENGHISKTTNDGIALAKGEFIAFMDCDDVIAPNALYEFAKKLNENHELDFIYSDEDKLTEDGKRRHSPFFKPDWSPDTFMSLMYTNHLAIYRKELVDKVGGLRSEFNGAQDYDFTLRFMEVSDNKRVGHISKVLYYWRERGESIASNPEAKPYALEAVRKAKEEAAARRGYHAHAEYVSDMFQYRMVYENANNDKVSIIIPSKDNPKLLFQCIDSVIKYTVYDNYEIIVVDNGSSIENKEKISEYTQRNNVKYHYEKMEFNFSRMCNIGAELATGEYLLFLNDDIEVYSKEWLSRLVGQATLSHCGAVGAKLYYPDSNVIQHVGVTNLGIGPSHNFIGFSDSVIYHFGRNRMDYDSLVVTAACLIVNRDKFYQVDGFDEKLTVAYNDVDLCFKLYEAGYYNVIRNDVSMYHHESASRGSDDIDEAKRTRLLKERKRLYEKHPHLDGKDPFYNKNLTQNKVNFEIGANASLIAPNKKVYKQYALSKYEKEFAVYVDKILYEDVVVIEGWFNCGNSAKTNLSNLKLMLRDKYGDICYFETYRMRRDDVANILGNDAIYAGFQCRISYENLNLHDTEYQIGLLVTHPFTFIKKCKWSDFVLNTISKETYCSHLKKCGLENLHNMKELEQYLIELYDKEEGIIRGWAVPGDSEPFYLVGKVDNSYVSYEVCRVQRPDVAVVNSARNGMLWSGFEVRLQETLDELYVMKSK